MNLKKRLLRNCKLYLVLDKGAAGKRDLIKIARLAVSGGVDILQLRWKNCDTEDLLKIGRGLRKITNKSNVLFIIDDDPYLANRLNADGVHLGQEDLSIKRARSILGPTKIIGYSTHNISQVKLAALKDIDYISIGPIFKTPIKAYYEPTGLKILARLKEEKLKLPIFAIGGINLSNIKKAVKNGLERVAVVRAIVKAKNPAKTAKLLKEALI